MQVERTETNDPTNGWLVCAVVWTALNFATIACIDERIDWQRAHQIETRTQIAYQWISSERNLHPQLQARLLPPPRSQAPVPLVIFLHGAGQRGADNVQQLQTLPQQLYQSSEIPCAVLAPQCPRGTSWSLWMPELEELIEHTIQQHHIDPDRIYLTGLSMGGFGSWELAARRPDLFAAILPVCGGGDLNCAESLKDLPLWAVHGTDDTVVLPERSREMITAIQAIGGTPRYTELPDVGHNCWQYAYNPESGILKWMFQQRREHSKAIRE